MADKRPERIMARVSEDLKNQLENIDEEIKQKPEAFKKACK